MYVCFHISAYNVGFGDMMIYKFVFSFIVFNILFEIIEVIFPSKFMNNFVKSVVMLNFYIHL